MTKTQFVETIDDKTARAVGSGRCFAAMLTESQGTVDASLFRNHRSLCGDLELRRALTVDEAAIEAIEADLCALIEQLSPGRAKLCLAGSDDNLLQFDPQIETLCDLLRQLMEFRNNRKTVLDWVAGERALRKLLQ